MSGEKENKVILLIMIEEDGRWKLMGIAFFNLLIIRAFICPCIFNQSICMIVLNNNYEHVLTPYLSLISNMYNSISIIAREPDNCLHMPSAVNYTSYVKRSNLFFFSSLCYNRFNYSPYAPTPQTLF